MGVVSLSRTDWQRMGVLLVVYFLTAKAGLTFSFAGSPVTLFWPPSGIALAALLLFGRRLWPGIFLGALLAVPGGSLSILNAPLFAAGNTVAAIIGATLLGKKSGFNHHLHSVQDVLRLLIFGALISTAISAANGAFWLEMLGAKTGWDAYGKTFVYWWMGDALGVVVFAPAVISFYRPDSLEWTPFLRRNLLLMFFVLILFCELIFTDLGKIIFDYRFRAFTLFPIIIWAAFIFNLRVVSTALLVIYGASLYGLHTGVGRFGTGIIADQVDVWLFNCVIALISLSMVMVNEQRKRAHDELAQSERNFKRAQRAVSMGSWMLDLRKNEWQASDEFYVIFGLSPECTLNYEMFINCVHPDDRARVEASWQDLMGGKQYDIEHRILANGQIKWVMQAAETDLDRFGKPIAAFGTVRDIARRMRVEEALRESKAVLQSVIDSALDAVIQINADGIVTGWNRQSENIFGWSSAEAIGNPLHEMIIPVRDRDAHVQGMKHFMTTGESRLLNSRIEMTALHRSGREFSAEIAVTPIIIKGVYEFSAFIRDITERKQAEAETRLAAEVFESSGEAIVITDADVNILSVNHAFTRVTGYTLVEVKGKNPRMLASGLHDAAFFGEMWAAISREDFWQGEIWDKDKSGRIYPNFMSISTIKDNHGKVTHYISISADISERKEAEKNIHALAYFDVLTSLPNRILLRDRIEQMVASSHRDQQKFSLLFIDLDRFKYVNDSMGHATGDKLLQVVAKRLLECVREGDTVSRIGGDEFIVLLRDTDAEGAASVAEKILNYFEVVSEIEGVQISTHASIGISIYPDNANDADTLIKNADVAMYSAKAQGRNNFQFFTPEMDFHAHHLFSMEKDLRLALERDEFTLHYQPQLDLITGKLCGVEALLRWKHPESGDISPIDFIPVAEETGQILPVGAWVLQTACSQLAEWRRQGMSNFPISVNLSVRQLRQTNLAQLVSNALRESGLSPGDLELELTEGIMMIDTQAAMEFLAQMHKLGVRLSIDDFGTGFSSLSYLKRMPLDRLKIDQSFVRDIETDENDAAIVRSIISLGHRFKLRVIAEGVETQEQMDFLRIRGCDEIQGFLFSSPLAADEFEAFVKKFTASS